MSENCLAVGYQAHFARFCTTFCCQRLPNFTVTRVLEVPPIVFLNHTPTGDNSVHEGSESAGVARADYGYVELFGEEYCSSILRSFVFHADG
jgi:hypothetical protein